MYKICKTDQSAARQRLLEQGLLELLAQTPWRELTVSRICAHLQIPRKAFYRYFPTREDALDALTDQLILDIAAFPAPPQPADAPLHYREMCRFFSYWYQHRDFLDIVQRDSLGPQFTLRTLGIALSQMDFFRNSLGRLPMERQIRAAGFFTGGLITVLLLWHQGGCAEPPELLARDAATLLGSGMLENLDIFGKKT